VDYSWTTIPELRSKLIAILEAEHAGLVSDLRVSSQGDTLILRGEVASEACRSDAKRFALAFDGVFKVLNELIVAAFLEAASDPDLDGFLERPRQADGAARDERSYEAKSGGPGDPTSLPAGGRAADEKPSPELVEIMRDPVIAHSGDLRPEQWINLTVDLCEPAHSGETTISLGTFPSNWTMIEIAVQLVTPWAGETIAETSFITIAANGVSEPARFRCRVSPEYEEGAPAQIHAVFVHGTRMCGHAERDLAAPAEAAPRPFAAEPKPAASGTQAPSADRAQFGVTPEAIGPDLSVSILRVSERDQRWTWRAIVPGGVVEGTGGVNLEGGDKEFADSLLRACPGLAPDRFERTLDGIGQRLWDVAPAEFRTAYEDWRSRIGTGFAIQFVTDDPYVPWEMMKPRLVGARHLFLDHPVARWPLSRAGRRRARFAGGAILSFVPRYAQHKALAFAIAEGEWVCAELKARAMTATASSFLDVLDGKHSDPVGVLHFAGHGHESGGVDAGGIELEDGVVNVADVHQDRVILGRRDGTLMVLNACETSAGARLLGMNSGWGAAIADREFGGMIAPLWEVQDEAAFAMTKAALPSLLNGTQSLGEAVTEARRTNSASSVATFAYLAHGDVMAKFATRP